jgi:hypothetical protein
MGLSTTTRPRFVVALKVDPAEEPRCSDILPMDPQGRTGELASWGAEWSLRPNWGVRPAE